MPTEAIVLLVVFIVVIMIPAIILSVIGMKNVRNHLVYNYDDHKIEVLTGFTFAKLIFDNKVIDEIKSLHMTTVKLGAIVNGIDIRVQIGSGFLKPTFRAFINNELVEMTKQ